MSCFCWPFRVQGHRYICIWGSSVMTTKHAAWWPLLRWPLSQAGCTGADRTLLDTRRSGTQGASTEPKSSAASRFSSDSIAAACVGVSKPVPDINLHNERQQHACVYTEHFTSSGAVSTSFFMFSLDAARIERQQGRGNGGSMSTCLQGASHPGTPSQRWMAACCSCGMYPGLLSQR